MNPVAAIWEGLRVARKVRSAAWVLFGANLVLAAVAALPIYRGAAGFSSTSLVGRNLAYGFSTDWLTDFSFNGRGALDRYARWLALWGMLAIPINSVLAGGVLARFRAPELPSSFGDFVHDTAKYCWRMFRLAVIGLIVYWAVFMAMNRGLDGLVSKWTRDWLDDRPVFWAHLAVTIPLLLGLLFVNLVMDFARVKLVLDETPSAIEAFLASLGFSLGRWRKAAVVYALPSLGGIAVLAVYLWLMPYSLFTERPKIENSWIEPLTVVLFFLLQQLAMFGRYWFRVATWAGEWTYYSGSR